MRHEPPSKARFIDRREQQAAVAKATRWVMSESQRLRVSPEEIARAIRCAMLPGDVEHCGSNLAFLTMVSGRSPKITKRGRYDGTERDELSGWHSFANAQQAHEKRRQPRQRRAA